MTQTSAPIPGMRPHRSRTRFNTLTPPSCALSRLSPVLPVMQASTITAGPMRRSYERRLNAALKRQPRFDSIMVNRAKIFSENFEIANAY
jgi:hypothetical protein